MLLFLGVFIVVWLAACGGNNNEPNNEGNDENNDDVEANNEDGPNNNDEEDITLRIAWWGDQLRTEQTNEVIKLFEDQNPHITLEAEYADWSDYWRKLAPQAAANELPDIIQMDLRYITQYADKNQLADLTPYLGEQIDTNNIDDNVISGGEVDDGIYGFALGINALGFHYNAELLDELGVGPIPDDWTWDDYIDLADQVADEGLVFDDSMESDVYFDYYLRTHGDRLYAEDGSGLGYDDDQLFVDFFDMLYDRVKAGSAPTPDALTQLSGMEDSSVVKEEGIGRWKWSNQFVGLSEVADFPLEIHPMPGPNVEDGLFLKSSMFFSVAENSEHKEAAAKFIRFFLNDPEANKIILAERGVPVSSEIKDTIKDEVSDAQIQVIEYIEWVEENSAPAGAAEPSETSEIIELLEDVRDEIMYDQIGVEDAAEKFRSDAEDIFTD